MKTRKVNHKWEYMKNQSRIKTIHTLMQLKFANISEYLRYFFIFLFDQFQKPIEYMEKQIPSKKLKQTDQEKSLNIQFLKKNTESNICNQILSFISLREKSQWFLTRILKNLELDQMEISVAFYNHIQKVKGNKKKYVNRRKILEISTSTLPTTSSSQFTSKLFRKLVRILIRTYLEKCCTISILTSKKMSKETCHPHLQRMRQIYKWLMNSFKNNQSE